MDFSRLLTPALAAMLLVCVAGCAVGAPLASREKPNVIIIVADDLGVGDLSHNGSIIHTPNIDALAQSGASFSQFYASANVCSPSRAGLLTGRYPIRMGLAHKVVEAGSGQGLPAEEITLAEELATRGYATALVGKWHLGDEARFWPTAHGFDEFFGVLHSNDMRPLVLFDGETALERPADQATLTRRYTERAIAFLEAHREAPFFLYLGHTFPHYPLHASEAFRGRSKAGSYGDAVEEIDWSLGEIMRALARLELTQNTLVMFTSDNGAWFEGSNQTLRDGKGHTFDGGYRVPMIMHWPGRIRPGLEVPSIAMNTDLLPTVLAAPGISGPPSDRQLDGESLWPVLNGEPAPADRTLVLFNNEDIAGVRTQRWKYLVRAYYRDNYAAFDRFEAGFGFAYPLLYDMSEPRPERYSVASLHPEITRRLEQQVEEARSEFEPLRTQPAARVVP
ncbi:MAG: sulfatase [Pseudomonadota bacterium]